MPRCWLRTLLSLFGSGLLAGCTASEAQTQSLPTFAAYQLETQQHLRQYRHFQTQDQAAELQWNSPREWRPTDGTHASKGILLVHGLGDSPWSFSDLAETLAAQGFLVRTVLLPGHGTSPEELLKVDIGQWRRVVSEQAQVLAEEVDQLYLGGFSTGANLVLEYAYGHPNVSGLLLFSPAFRASSHLGWLTPLLSGVRPWLVAPNGQRPMQNSVRYLNTPTNGFAQFHRSSVTAQQLLADSDYDKPVVMVVAEHDSVLDTGYLLRQFQQRFTHPDSRLIWYGEPSIDIFDRLRVLVRADRLPALRISQFSHMGLLFSPRNPLYGEQGSLRICLNGQQPDATQACELGEPVWYSDWGYQEAGKVHARLTFNPYFDWQASVIAVVLGSQSVSPERALTVLHPPTAESP